MRVTTTFPVWQVWWSKERCVYPEDEGWWEGRILDVADDPNEAGRLQHYLHYTVDNFKVRRRPYSPYSPNGRFRLSCARDPIRRCRFRLSCA